jgi:hypothetical protein
MARNMRRKPRREMACQAWVRVQDGFSMRKCTVNDISDTGVQIELAAPQFLSNQFMLLMSGAGGPARACRVKWRRGSHVGAEFIAA